MLEEIARIMEMTEEEIWHHPKLLVNAFDHEHRVLYWNGQCEQYFDIKQEDALGKIFEDIVPHARGNKKMDYLDRALQGEPVYIVNEKYDKKDSLYDQVIIPLKNDAGQVTGALSITIDLTGQREKRSDKVFSFLFDLYVKDSKK